MVDRSERISYRQALTDAEIFCDNIRELTGAEIDPEQLARHLHVSKTWVHMLVPETLAEKAADAYKEVVEDAPDAYLQVWADAYEEMVGLPLRTRREDPHERT